MSQKFHVSIPLCVQNEYNQPKVLIFFSAASGFWSWFDIKGHILHLIWQSWDCHYFIEFQDYLRSNFVNVIFIVPKFHCEYKLGAWNFMIGINWVNVLNSRVRVKVIPINFEVYVK